jgi:hypothetical protein
MKIELELILKQINSKFFMKIIKIEDLKVSKKLVSRLNQRFHQKISNNNTIKLN